MRNKTLFVLFFFFLSFSVCKSSSANYCFKAKNEEKVYKALYECYQEVPKNNIDNKSYPWCQAMHLCLATKKVFSAQNGNICLDEEKFSVRCVQK